MLKGTNLYGILNMKCPHCQGGKFFVGHPYRLSTMGKVKKRCEKCNQKFELETGFYQGSYYVSYGLGVALFVAVVVLNVIFREKLTPGALMISFVLTLFFLIPLLYHLSKIIWASLFMKYDSAAITTYKMKLQDDTRA